MAQLEGGQIGLSEEVLADWRQACSVPVTTVSMTLSREAVEAFEAAMNDMSPNATAALQDDFDMAFRVLSLLRRVPSAWRRGLEAWVLMAESALGTSADVISGDGSEE